MTKRIKVAVLMGGKSPEHKISLLSGRQVIKNLDPQKYQIISVIISRDGNNWQINNDEKVKIKDLFKISSIFKNHKIDLVFIAMHGPYGEDGSIQGFLELIGIPYTGSSILASSLGMNKIYSRKLFTQFGLKTPKYFAIKKGENTNEIFKTLKLPVFVKPNNQGSSVGVSKVNKKEDFKKALLYAHKFSDFALVEEFIEGVEVTCAIIGNDKPKALPLVEIVPKKEFFDYEAKYSERLCDEIIPARINKILTKKAQEAAIAAYRSLGCKGFGRVDMITKNHTIYILEINTIPGLTPVSLVPKAAKAGGMSYSQLLDKIIHYSLGV